ncbi:30S ribosomal protein S4 [Candidatus Aenigmatarchaeota archaeon]
MGHPKKHRRKTSNPFRPYDKERIQREKTIMKEFGLRRKKEIRKAESILRNFRRRARRLQASKDENKEKALFDKLHKMGLVKPSAKLEEVLEINVEDILSRRLQTVIYKKGLANTVSQARQTITHGHICIDDRRVKWPGVMVTVDLENKIELNKKMHGTLKGVSE